MKEKGEDGIGHYEEIKLTEEEEWKLGNLVHLLVSSVRNDTTCEVPADMRKLLGVPASTAMMPGGGKGVSRSGESSRRPKQARR